MKIKPSQNGEITLPLTDEGKLYPSRKFLNVKNMSFNAIYENKILTKISELTIVKNVIFVKLIHYSTQVFCAIQYGVIWALSRENLSSGLLLSTTQPNLLS